MAQNPVVAAVGQWKPLVVSWSEAVVLMPRVGEEGRMPSASWVV